MSKLKLIEGEYMSDSDLLFGRDEPAEELEPDETPHTGRVWRVLIVDDEEQVHKVTSLVLNLCKFDQDPIELVHAYSMKEASEILSEQPPFALALIDVVMETDDAGLRLVQYIREELKDDNIRLVLRTGQPGQAPEETVIARYDINDYKNKTELTSTKLKTLLYSALRSFRDIRTIATNRQGLFNLIAATSKIVDIDQLPLFATAVLEEVGNLLNLESDAICTHTPLDAIAAKAEDQQYSILAATGSIKDRLLHSHKLPAEITQYFDKAKSAHHGLYENGVFVGYYNTSAVGENFLYVKPNAPLDNMGQHLLGIYTRCVAITHHNLHHKDQIQKSRQELVFILSETIEKRIPDESKHVRRVSKMAFLLAQKVSNNESWCERIRLATPLHDIGTIGIDDEILNKPSKFTPQEREKMQVHTEIGAAILGKSERPVLKIASIMAAQHHERWDGSGYPNGLKGEETDITARIIGIVDIIDALGSHKSYRNAFRPTEIVGYLNQEKGVTLDPVLTDYALGLMDDFQRIRLLHPDAHH
jgi:response regulator RpfG family c-di-GMP phosphodiesterase